MYGTPSHLPARAPVLIKTRAKVKKGIRGGGGFERAIKRAGVRGCVRSGETQKARMYARGNFYSVRTALELMLRVLARVYEGPRGNAGAFMGLPFMSVSAAYWLCVLPLSLALGRHTRRRGLADRAVLSKGLSV